MLTFVRGVVLCGWRSGDWLVVCGGDGFMKDFMGILYDLELVGFQGKSEIKCGLVKSAEDYSGGGG